MATRAFSDIPRIEYEGPKSKNPLAFKHYHADEKLGGKPLRDHLRFAVCYWHTFRNPLGDPFGVGTAIRPWEDGSNSVANAQRRVRVAFENALKLMVDIFEQGLQRKGAQARTRALSISALCVGGNFTMDAEDAVKAAGFVQCDNILGVHFDTFPPIQINHGEAFAKFQAAGKKLHLLNIGESHKL